MESSSQSQSTFITLLELARPQSFSMARPFSRRAASLAAALAAAAPLFARASEGIWGIAPCELCLWQRWPYWVAAALALAAALWPGGRRVLGALAILAVLASGAVAAFHVGVEQG